MRIRCGGAARRARARLPCPGRLSRSQRTHLLHRSLPRGARARRLVDRAGRHRTGRSDGPAGRSGLRARPLGRPERPGRVHRRGRSGGRDLGDGGRWVGSQAADRQRRRRSDARALARWRPHRLRDRFRRRRARPVDDAQRRRRRRAAARGPRRRRRPGLSRQRRLRVQRQRRRAERGLRHRRRHDRGGSARDRDLDHVPQRRRRDPPGAAARPRPARLRAARRRPVGHPHRLHPRRHRRVPARGRPAGRRDDARVLARRHEGRLLDRGRARGRGLRRRQPPGARHPGGRARRGPGLGRRGARRPARAADHDHQAPPPAHPQANRALRVRLHRGRVELRVPAGSSRLCVLLGPGQIHPVEARRATGSRCGQSTPRATSIRARPQRRSGSSASAGPARPAQRAARPSSPARSRPRPGSRGRRSRPGS